MMLYQVIQNWLASLVKDQEGQGLAEYALILVLVSIAVLIALTLLGTNISTILNNIAQVLTN